MNIVETKWMNDIERTLTGTAHASVCLAADGSSSSGPRGDDPQRPGIELGDMLEMGLESLLMHFRRKPGGQVVADNPDRIRPDKIRMEDEDGREPRE
jgi:hypothetical protein